ncbi:hypothetical protein ACS0TY_035882 [Phlomoides rotata]
MNAVNSKLTILWAPFLLLHLGGPDNITAFSYDDNESWLRHSVQLLLQLAAVIYLFIQSLPNEYWIPTCLMLFAGAYKYAERSFALHHACFDNIRSSLLPKPNPGPHYIQFMEENCALKEAHVPVEIKTDKDSADGIQSPDTVLEEVLDKYTKLVIEGYTLFNDFN